MIACIGDDQWHTFNTLAQSSQVSMAGVTALAPGFNRLLRDLQLRRSVVRALLLNWQHEGALQLELYGKAMEYLSHFNGEISVSAFCQWLGERTEIGAELRMTIAQIQSLEPLLVLAATLMEWLQGQKGGDHATLCNVLQPRILDLNLSAPWQMVAGLPHRAFLTTPFRCWQRARRRCLDQLCTGAEQGCDAATRRRRTTRVAGRCLDGARCQ